MPRPYIDRGEPGTLRYRGDVLLTVAEPPRLTPRILKLHEIRRQNSLEPELMDTHRILLRWSEGGGSGLPNPEADVREVHYDPLPPDLQEKVDDIVDNCHWKTLTIKRYRSSLSITKLAQEIGKPRNRLYEDLRAALWYFRGRFEKEGIYG
jgi:hypothetical protein